MAIPRHGKNITLPRVHLALMMAFHLSPFAAGAFMASLPLLCREDGTFDLVDTRRNNIIEHDSSFLHLDFHQGDNYTFQRDTLQAMIGDAEGGPVTPGSLVKTFIRRGKESRDIGDPRLKLWFFRMIRHVVSGHEKKRIRRVA